MKVGFDATAAAAERPTGIGLAIAHLVHELHATAASTDLELDVVYRWSRVRRRRTFLPKMSER